jgi:hypothetical protein
MNEMKMGMLPTEQASLEDVMVDGVERYENSILSNVPSGLAEKGILAVRLFHYFLDSETINEWTGKKTMLDIEECYIMSGIYPDDHLMKVYEVKEIETEKEKNGSTWTEYSMSYKIIDKREDMRIRTEARRFWADNQLDTFFQEATQYKRGNIPFTDQLKFAIETDALKPGDIQNRKMAMDIHGMKNKNNKLTINVFRDGNGSKLARTIIDSSNNDVYELGIDDDE